MQNTKELVEQSQISQFPVNMMIYFKTDIATSGCVSTLLKNT